VKTHASALGLGGLLLLVSVGQFAVFFSCYVPRMKHDYEICKETRVIVEMDNAKEKDVAAAVQRDNFTLNEVVRTLRGKNDELEKRITELTPKRAGPKSTPIPAHWFQPRGSNKRYHVKILTPESNRPLARTLESGFSFLLLQVDQTQFVDVRRNVLVYYAEEDKERAAYLGAFLKIKHQIEAPLKLSPDPEKKGTFHVCLTP